MVLLLMQELIVATFEEKGDLRNAPIFRTLKQFFSQNLSLPFPCFHSWSFKLLTHSHHLCFINYNCKYSSKSVYQEKIEYLDLPSLFHRLIWKIMELTMMGPFQQKLVMWMYPQLQICKIWLRKKLYYRL